MLWTGMIAGMFFILAAVGWTQYHWSRRVADATQARILASLKASMVDWHLNLLREIAEPCFAMQINTEPDSREHWSKYLRRYSAWYQTARRPELYANLYLVRISAEGTARASRLDRNTNGLHREYLSPRFDELLEELKRQSENREWLERKVIDDPTTKADNVPGQMPHDPLYGWQFEQKIPALVHPLLRTDVLQDEAGTRGSAHHEKHRDYDADDLQPVSWIVIELDAKVLQERVLPELTQHYFGGPQGANYDTAVVAGRSEHVLYASTPEFAEHPFENPDATLDLFGPPPTGYTALAHDFAGDFHAGGAKDPTTVEERRNLSAPTWLPVLHGRGETPHWTLVVHHRGGSLEEQIAATRRRDLLLTSGVLLLLASGMTMLVIATRRAQRLARLQMEFVATVSHELRTPLAVICSAADNLSDGLVTSPHQLARYGETIKIQGKQLITLVEEILLFASTREQRAAFQFELTDVKKIVEAVLTNTAGLVELSGVRLESEIAPDLPPVVVDLGAVCQCLQNLVINAVKYGGEAKWVRVTARQVQAANRSEVQIAVEDRGIGMSSAELAHIFEPFYRSPHVTAAQIRGTGLGLPLAKSLAEAMRGSITVVSAPDQGSTFTLHLPAAASRGTGTSIQDDETMIEAEEKETGVQRRIA